MPIPEPPPKSVKEQWAEYWKSKGQPNLSLPDKYTSIDDLNAKQLEILQRIELLLGGGINPQPPQEQYWLGRTRSYEDTSFVTGDSPKVLDVNEDLKHNAHDGYMVCDGAGNITLEISDDGLEYGEEHTIKQDEIVDFFMLDIDKIRLTWIANSAYRILVI